MTRYEYGFLTKCAEYGVDGTKLIKQAKIPIGNGLKFVERMLTGKLPGEPSGYILRSINRAKASGRPFSKGVMENLTHLDSISKHVKKLNDTGWVGSRDGAKLKSFITALDGPGDDAQKTAIRNLLFTLGYMK